MPFLRFAATLLLIGSAVAPTLAAEDPPATADQNAQTPATGNPAKPAQTTPPYPRDGTDLKTQIREQQEYMVWMYENNADQTSLLLKLKPGIESRPRTLISTLKAKEIGSIVGLELEPRDLVSLPDWQVLKLPQNMTAKAVAEELCPKLKQHPEVSDCSQNGSGHTYGVPTDIRFGEQWSFRNGPGGGNIEKAWDTTTGVASTVVAILDSGISSHEDLSAARILPGYDFVTDPVVANDNSGRDADPSDTGNWVSEAERNGSGSLRNCKVQNSDWHGTHVAGTIGATANNTDGIAGIDWAAKLLPVRVVGKCGNRGNFSLDLTAAIQWAAGVNIGTAPVNPNPAKVINMSLSGTGTCPPTVQAAIDEATRRGAVVIASAGNDSAWGNFWPANCQNVLTVVATDAVGDKASFSNWGIGVGVSAPGTDILSTVNPGTTVPVAGSAYRAYSGTSMAAAHVSGIASLMLAAKPSLTPFEIREIIKASSKPFARGSDIILGSCGSGFCGVGIVDGARAVTLSRMGKAAVAYDANGGDDQSYIVSTLPNGQVVGWGKAKFGQLGNATLAPLSQPTLVPGLTQIDRVFAGGTTTWAIRESGEAYAMGQGAFCGEAFFGCPSDTISFFGGDPLASASSVPVRTPRLDNAKQISVGYFNYSGPTGGISQFPQIYAITPTGQVLAWGYNFQGLLGLGTYPATPYVISSPTVVDSLPPIQRVVTTGYMTLALDQSGSVWGWGFAMANDCNAFGSGAPELSPVPRKIPSLDSVIDIGLSYGLAVAVKEDGTVWQWGCRNADSFASAVKIPLDRVVSARMSSSIGFAILADGSLWRWPYNDTSNPVQLLSGGAIGFSFPNDTNDSLLALVRLADGHLFAPFFTPSGLTTSDQSPQFAVRTLGAGYSGRFNAANVAFNDDSDIQVALASNAASVNIDQSVDYTVSISNAGSGAANHAVATVALPDEMSVQSVPAGCDVFGQLVTCNLGSVGAGQTSALAIKTSAHVAGMATATAYAYSDSYDYERSNDVAGVDVNVRSDENADAPLPPWAILALGMGFLFTSARRTAPPA